MSAPIDDFGEKIGGARKDLRGNFRRSDVETMTHIERQKLVTKANVWPTPDYVAMVEEGGYTRDAALMVKMLRDALPAAPVAGRRATDAQFADICTAYVEAVNAAKDVAAAGKTAAQLADAMNASEAVKQYLVQIRHRPGSGIISEGHTYIPVGLSAAEDQPWRVRDHLLTACMEFARGKLDYPTRRMFTRNPQWPRGTSQAEGWIRKQRLGIMAAKQEGRDVWVLSYWGRPAADQYDPEYHAARLPFGPMLTKVFESQEQGEKDLLELAEGLFDKRRESAKAQRQALIERANGAAATGVTAADVYRQGEDWRSGVPATGEQYLKDFRVRGGEFGLWVNQTERQLVLDRGYDGFRDLCAIFGWPNDAISLGGSLAIAFGARGRGGANPAAAHYEATRQVINLTKPHGAGCLAHEWGHAADHYLGTRAHALGLVQSTVSGGNYDGEGYMLSNCVLRSPGANETDEHKFIRRVRSAMEGIWTKEVTHTKESYVTTTQRRLNSIVAEYQGEINRICEYLKNVALPRNGWAPAHFDSLLKRCRTELEVMLDPQKVCRGGVAASCMANIRSIVGRKGSLAWAENNLGYYQNQLLHAQVSAQEVTDPKWEPPVHRVSTEYIRQCRALDEGRTKPYYATNHEMFARTFETLVHDAIETRQQRSSFLVSCTSGQAFPAGEERTAATKPLTAALQDLPTYLPKIVQEVQEVETLSTLRATGFLSDEQATMMRELCGGAEAEFYAGKISELAKIVETMPSTGRGGRDPIAQLHYFKGGLDWYVTEKDGGSWTDTPEEAAAQLQAYGVRTSAAGQLRWGYINLKEVLAMGAELDLHWNRRPVSALMQAARADMPPVPATKNSGTTLTR